MYQFIEAIELNQFQLFARTHPLGSIYQSVNWPDVKTEWTHDFVCVQDKDQLIGGAMILFRPLSLGYKMAYIPRGPLLDYENQELIDFFFLHLKAYCKKRKVIVCKFDPNIVIYKGSASDIQSPLEARNHTLVQAIQHGQGVFQGYTTNMNDLIQPRFQCCFTFSEQWADTLPKKTINKIHTSFNKGVSIEINPDHAVKTLAEMISYTEKRKNIFLRNENYFQTMVNSYQEDACILIAKLNHSAILVQLDAQRQEVQTLMNHLIDNAPKRLKQYTKQLEDLEIEIEKVKSQKTQDGDDVVISALLLLKNNTTCELLYSGLNENYRRYLAAYSLRYTAMKWAHEKGCTRFNFGGVQGSLDDGLFTFKSSFNPSIEVYIGEFDLPISPLLYPLFKNGLPVIKKGLKKLRGRKN